MPRCCGRYAPTLGLKVMRCLNILISGADHAVAGRGPLVYLREGYSAVDADWQPLSSPHCREFAMDAVEAMRAYVAELRAAWGPLHVQDNSGLVPDLDQGPWAG